MPSAIERWHSQQSDLPVLIHALRAVLFDRYHHHDNVLGSSNLRDIIDYCDEYGIKYLTTIDFLYYAIKRGIITKEEADEFVIKVRSNNSRLPNVDFSTYKCDKLSIVS